VRDWASAQLRGAGMKCSTRAQRRADAVRGIDLRRVGDEEVAETQTRDETILRISVAGRKTFWFEKIFSLRSRFPKTFSAAGLSAERRVTQLTD